MTECRSNHVEVLIGIRIYLFADINCHHTTQSVGAAGDVRVQMKSELCQFEYAQWGRRLGPRYTILHISKGPSCERNERQTRLNTYRLRQMCTVMSVIQTATTIQPIDINAHISESVESKQRKGQFTPSERERECESEKDQRQSEEIKRKKLNIK